MKHYFLYGALAQTEALKLVLGQPDEFDHTTARVSGFALPQRPGPLALASEAKNGLLNGIALSGLTKEQAERLSFALYASGGHWQKVDCLTDDGCVEALMAVSHTPQTPCSDDAPIGAIERGAMAEIMSYHPSHDAETIARRRSMILARAAARQAASRPKPANLRSDTHSDTVALHTQKTSHQGFFLTRSYELSHPQFDGQQSPVLTREAFIATDAAIVLPYDPVRDRVLLVEQFRMGPYGRGDAKPWMLEPVAGRVDAGESPEQCARRECTEEAGLELQKLIKISSHYCSPGCSTEYFHLFLGICDLPDDRPDSGGLDTEHEDLRLHVISYDAAQTLLDTGEADNGPLVLSLLWLSKTRAGLRASA